MENLFIDEAIVHSTDSGIKVCHFCKLSEPRFSDSEEFDLHLWRECKMLTTCSECQQIIEVAEYNTHLLD